MTVATGPDFLQESALRVVFFGGKGGVGKSTCAVATALTLALDRPDQHFLLVSTDPAHSLRHILSHTVLPKNLAVHELDAVASLHEFKRQNNAELQAIAERGTLLDQQDIQGLLDAALPGMDELAAYLEIAAWIQQDRYHQIIIDTAPTGHTLRLLEMPILIKRWLTALNALLAKHRYLRKHFNGSQKPDRLDRFLLALNHSLKAMHRLITDKQRCGFIVVMLAEAMSVEESIDLIAELDKKHLCLLAVIINQLVPENRCPNCLAKRERQMLALNDLFKRLPYRSFWTLPLFAEEPRGQLLNTLWLAARFLDNRKTLAATVSPVLPVRVENPSPLPAGSLKLLLFTGKGGVGKTTLACATALRLHQAYPELRILLLSTDPAHSLSDCLKINVQQKPTLLLETLDAQEINAEADFGQIRRHYRAELERFLEETLPNFDISFDREVMEHLLDLAPPGLDEIMALTAIIDHLDSRRYHLIIVDTSPSGHLLRLLELPELIRNWLKLFFSLLLKYRKVIHLPQLSKKLVNLARALKSLRILLQNPEQTALYAVTIPSRLAIEKTYDMTTALAQLGIIPKALFINQMTPANHCALCQVIAVREALALERVSTMLLNYPHTHIFQQSEPAGLPQLISLGAALFSNDVK